MEENDKIITELEKQIKENKDKGKNVDELETKLKHHKDIINDHLAAAIAVALEKEKLGPRHYS